MGIMLGAVSLLLVSGFGALLLNQSPRRATFVGVGGVVVASLLGLAAVMLNFVNGQAMSLALSLAIPYASFSIEVDALSAFFLVPIFFLSALAAIYGAGYLKSWYGKKSIGTSWFFYNVLVASMVMVVMARNAFLFLFFWEMMTVASYFLVTFENEKASVRGAGLMYLAASQLGTAFLLVLFILLGRETGSLDFNQFQVSAGALPSVIFLLAVVGFGTKAGFMPFHIWLPEAHPAAPSHVSALMSGVMIKTGIYGLIRVLLFLGPPSAWWGGLLIIVGIVSGILGILLALAQSDLKRFLAYSSIENIGIITMGLGLGLLGMSMQSPALMILGWAGGLWHVLNHAFFKGLLFLGAGAVIHATGTNKIDCLGGLLKRMPLTGICFLIGSAAICGLPLLNGFVSEFLIYLGSFYGIRISVSAFLAVLGIIAALAIIGGLAAACFTKAFGIIFLGAPRVQDQRAHEAGWLMRLPMVVLAVTCILTGLFAPVIIFVFSRVLSGITGLAENIVSENLQQAAGVLANVTKVGIGVLGFLGIILFIRRRLLKGRSVKQTVTWDCGYAAPSARMQYTGFSFAQPLVDLFSVVLRRRRQFVRPEGIFQKSSSFSTTTPDLFVQNVYRPVLEIFYRYMSRLRFFQHGRLQIYILYIIFTLLVLFVWKLW